MANRMVNCVGYFVRADFCCEMRGSSCLAGICRAAALHARLRGGCESNEMAGRIVNAGSVPFLRGANRVSFPFLNDEGKGFSVEPQIREIRELMDAAAAAIEARDADEYAGYAETTHIMIQQHNMKEENVLYPMCDQHLAGESAWLVARMREGIAD